MESRTLGHYHILEKIGAGGMGEVFLARDTTLERDVALKLLSPELASDPERLQRFEREAKAVAALNHPNIVTLHTFEEADGQHFITMEHVAGRTLADLIPTDGMPLARLFEIAIPTAEALAAAHEKGVIHRDLKPGNVMVDEEGRVKVLDFGLAKLRREPSGKNASEVPTAPLTREGHVMGTLSYMAPEQLRGARVDARVDLYSFGIMLYELATGDRPFSGDTSADLASAILKESPKPLEELRPDLPFRFGQIVGRCLEKEPKRRTQSALDLRHELEDFMKEWSLPSHEAVAAETAAEGGLQLSRSRTRWLAALAFAGLALFVVVVILLFQQVGKSPQTGARTIGSLAVLPFDNLMNDPAQDYFVDGMHEALLTDLAKMNSTRVISRSSVMGYKDAPKPIKVIARELDVDALIEGSVLRSGNQVRITAQLIDGATDEHLWAESYDRDLEDVLGLLSEVSRAIAGEIQVTVAARPDVVDIASPKINPEAYEAYLRGQQALNLLTQQELLEARRLFETSIEADPKFAAAWAGLGTTYFFQAFFGREPQRDAIPKAREAAHKALELDPDVGHGLAGVTALYFDWDWPAAKRHFEKALTLHPHDSDLRHGYADYLLITGKPQKSYEQVLLGRRYDPRSYMAHRVLLGHALLADRYEDTITEGRRTLETFPDLAGTYKSIGDALWLMGRYEEAIVEYEAYYGADSALFHTFKEALERSGPKGALKAKADFVAQRAKKRRMSPLAVAELYAWAGENDAAFEWLEIAYQERIPQLLHVPYHPCYGPIRSDPRFEALLERVGIPRESE